MRIKKICVITDQYPTENDPIYSFLDEVVCRFADRGIECIVICPKPIFERHHKASSRIRYTATGAKIKIYCPKYIPCSGIEIGKVKMWKYSMYNIYESAYRTFIRYVRSCDVIYAHFYKNGIIASKIAQKKNIPVFVASGESSFDTGLKFYKAFSKEISKLNGVIAVSSDVKNRIYKYGLLPQNNNIIVLPNGVNMTNFKKLEKEVCRKKLGIPNDLFIVAFVGHFIERKGINRVIDAVNACQDVYAFFIGDNALPNPCDKALFVGKVPHNEVSIYLSAADAFILPSTDEGCCNAIVEAQVMELPIIASRLPFNEDILPGESAVLVDPMNTEDIINAFLKLKNDKYFLNKMVGESHKLAPERDIEIRIEKILSFIEKTIY